MGDVHSFLTSSDTYMYILPYNVARRSGAPFSSKAETKRLKVRRVGIPCIQFTSFTAKPISL